MKKYRITLTDQERTQLEHLISVGKAAARKLTHARILLLADMACPHSSTDEDIRRALHTSLRTIERVRQRFVTEGFAAALDHRPQPPRPDKIKIKGDVEQKLIELACSEPPEGRCHWTLQMLADELVVLGLAESMSTETIRQALKKTTSNRGSSRRGASRPKPMPSSSGGWKMFCKRTACLMPRSILWCVLTKRASSCSERSADPSRPGREIRPRSITNTNAKAFVTS